MDDDSTSQPKAKHSIKEHDGSFELTKVSSSHKNGSYVYININLNLDLAIWVNPIEIK
jgi:hypothetical protein